MVLLDSNLLIAAWRFATLGLSARSYISPGEIFSVSNATDVDGSSSDATIQLPETGQVVGDDASTRHGGTLSAADSSVATQSTSNPTFSPSLSGSLHNETEFLNVTAFSDSSCNPESYDGPVVPLFELPGPNPARATVYRYRQQQGVNLGSWFMLEGWMVPSLFSCAAAPAISEHDVASGWNGQAKQVLEKHWDTFITESDFAWMASLGINTVRLPLGYWHIGTGEQEWTTDTLYESVRDHYVGAWPRVLRAVSWAEKHEIGVLIDLHGAPGSQNGQHHSGVSDGQTNLFSSPSNIQKTIAVLEFLTKTFVNVPNVVGIQLLNEPINIPEVFDFYNNALNSLRGIEAGAQSFPFYLHDAFDLNRGTDFVRSRGREWNVLDHHSYYVFTPYDNAKSATAHTTDLSLAGSVGSSLMAAGMGLNGNLVIGEWSCALSEDSLRDEENPIAARRQFCEVQERTYRDTGSGSTFWSLTKEDCHQDPAWCFKSAVGNSLPASFFSYEGLLVAKDLNNAIGVSSASTDMSRGAAIGSEGNPPLSDTSHVTPLTWAIVSSTLSATSTTSTESMVPLDFPGTTTVSAADMPGPTSISTSIPVFTTVDPVPSASATMAGIPLDPQPASSESAQATETPIGSNIMKRVIKSNSTRSHNVTGEQLPPLPEVLAHTGRPDADVPMGTMDHRKMVMNNCSMGTVGSYSGLASDGLSRAHRRWSTREHRSMSIHARKMTRIKKRKDQINIAKPTDAAGHNLVPSQSSLRSKAISSHSKGLPDGTALRSHQVLKNGTLLQTNDAPQLSPAQEAIQRGFSDGFMTAKIFAQQGPGMSRLGFKWQYVEDSLAAHGSKVSPGKEGYYREWFDKGLIQGETMVAQVIARMNA